MKKLLVGAKGRVNASLGEVALLTDAVNLVLKRSEIRVASLINDAKLPDLSPANSELTDTVRMLSVATSLAWLVSDIAREARSQIAPVLTQVEEILPATGELSSLAEECGLNLKLLSEVEQSVSVVSRQVAGSIEQLRRLTLRVEQERGALALMEDLMQRLQVPPAAG